MFTTGLIPVAEHGLVIDMVALSAAFWAPELLEATVNLIISNLDGSETLGLKATPLYFEQDDVIVVGFIGNGFEILKRTGCDLVLVQNEMEPDKIFSAAGGTYLASLEILTP